MKLYHALAGSTVLELFALVAGLLFCWYLFGFMENFGNVMVNRYLDKEDGKQAKQHTDAVGFSLHADTPSHNQQASRIGF